MTMHRRPPNSPSGHLDGQAPPSPRGSMSARSMRISALLAAVLVCNVVAWMLVVHHHHGLLTHDHPTAAKAASTSGGMGGISSTGLTSGKIEISGGQAATLLIATGGRRAMQKGESSHQQRVDAGVMGRDQQPADQDTLNLVGVATTAKTLPPVTLPGPAAATLPLASPLPQSLQSQPSQPDVANSNAKTQEGGGEQDGSDDSLAPEPPVLDSPEAQDGSDDGINKAADAGMTALQALLNQRRQNAVKALNGMAQQSGTVQAVQQQVAKVQQQQQQQQHQQYPQPRAQTSEQRAEAMAKAQKQVASHQSDASWPPVWWFAPFFDRTSFGKEAATMLLGAMRSGAVNESSLWLGTTQGNCRYGVDTSMPRADFDQLDAGVKRAMPDEPAIVVCHSLPPFWARPRHHWDSCAPCPPLGYTPAMAIGRAMAETDIYNWAFVEQCNRMDEVWVPSKFSYDTLVASGVAEEKLHIVPIAVNTTMFDPDIIEPLPLPFGDLVFGKMRHFAWHRLVLQEDLAASGQCPSKDEKYDCARAWRLRATCRAAGRRDCEQSFKQQVFDLGVDNWPDCASVAGYAAKSHVDHVLDDIMCQEGDDLQEAADACTAHPNCTAFNLDPYGGHWCLKSSAQVNKHKDAVGVCFYRKQTDTMPGPVTLPNPMMGPSPLGKMLLSISMQRPPSRAGRQLTHAADPGQTRGLGRQASASATAFGTGTSSGASSGVGRELKGVAAVVAGSGTGSQGLGLRALNPERSGLRAQGAQGARGAGFGAQGSAASQGLAASETLGTTSGVPPADAAQHSGEQPALPPPRVASKGRPFVFVSTFKWEMRKGWDVLLSAYLQEFTVHDDVELYILTKPFANSGSDFKTVMRKWAREHLNMTDSDTFPNLYVISSHITQQQYTGLFRSAHCYVSPTRGEGWGMPITEAMAMGMPAIVTNWSGTADFVDESVGYPLRYTLSDVPDDQLWWFKGARWADADVQHLRQRMRHVYENREEAAAKGAAARRLMHEQYSPAAVGAALAVQVARVRAAVRSGNCSGGKCFSQEYVADPGDFWGPDPYPEGGPRRGVDQQGPGQQEQQGGANTGTELPYDLVLGAQARAGAAASLASSQGHRLGTSAAELQAKRDAALASLKAALKVAQGGGSSSPGPPMDPTKPREPPDPPHPQAPSLPPPPPPLLPQEPASPDLPPPHE